MYKKLRERLIFSQESQSDIQTYRRLHPTGSIHHKPFETVVSDTSARALGALHETVPRELDGRTLPLKLDFKRIQQIGALLSRWRRFYSILDTLNRGGHEFDVPR